MNQKDLKELKKKKKQTAEKPYKIKLSFEKALKKIAKAKK
jgi:hypothetical protein